MYTIPPDTSSQIGGTLFSDKPVSKRCLATRVTRVPVWVAGLHDHREDAGGQSGVTHRSLDMASGVSQKWWIECLNLWQRWSSHIKLGGKPTLIQVQTDVDSLKPRGQGGWHGDMLEVRKKTSTSSASIFSHNSSDSWYLLIPTLHLNNEVCF